ncbi:outer membrane protein [Rhizobium tumorigenes]|uniref:Porin family protein n=1 Tax=Rhizobium tumorigenes TaxID=2041385 RepID=A0AAF1KFZ0_9HYPH|nr:porin family protein [Rhizobium tumorigenes]WFR99286.1 porin family protein [Rhizobium tumorigenes]WFS04430.1 porin family protein [Rhizobium tumorigenes]
MKKLLLAALVSTSLVSVAAAADMTPPMQPPAAVDNGVGFYIGSLSSVSFLKHTDFDVAGFNIDTKYDTGFYSALRGGYNFGSMGFVAPRVELEVGYGTASVDEHKLTGFGGFGSINSYGDANTIQGFVNGYLDIPLAPAGETGVLAAFTPYVGGGVGAINLNLRKQGVGGVGTLIDDNNTAFAYHLDAGVGINLQSMPLFASSSLFEKTTLDIGYRYTAADNFDFTARDGSTSSTDYRSNAVTFGIRKQF